MQWSWANQLAQTYSSSSAAARYAYGGDGQRVVKRFGSLSGSVLTPSKVTVYLPGGFEITGSFSGGALQVEWQSLAVMDDRTCVARFEVKAVDGGVATGEAAVLRYQVGNHLGSACLETSEAGQVLTREEYYAYGGTAYAFAASGAAGFSVKRYRYAGKECDSENGLYYFGARYFAAWLGRWTAGDPVFAAGRSAYEFCSGNPGSRVDPDGAADKPVGGAVGLPGDIAPTTNSASAVIEDQKLVNRAAWAEHSRQRKQVHASHRVAVYEEQRQAIGAGDHQNPGSILAPIVGAASLAAGSDLGTAMSRMQTAAAVESLVSTLDMVRAPVRWAGGRVIDMVRKPLASASQLPGAAQRLRSGSAASGSEGGGVESAVEVSVASKGEQHHRDTPESGDG